MEQELSSRGTVLHDLFSTGKAKLLQSNQVTFHLWILVLSSHNIQNIHDLVFFFIDTVLVLLDLSVVVC